MSFLRSGTLALVAGLMVFGATAAQAFVTFTNATIGRKVEVNYLGRVSSGGGQVDTNLLSAITIYTLKSISADQKRWTFDYTITNNSSVTTATLMAAGFDVMPTGTTLKTVGATGQFDNYIANGQFPVSYGRVDVCLSANKNCTGGNPNNALTNAAPNNSASGTFFMDFRNAPTKLALDHFVTRFQAIAPKILGNDSGIAVEKTFKVTNGDGTPGPVPEPAQWLMLIAGFGVTGAALRRRKAGREFACPHAA